jgi:hypothetical protein
MMLASRFSTLATTLCVVVVASFGLATAQAGIYKWVDDDGQVHYGERPVGQAAEKLRIKVPAPATPAASTAEDNKKDDSKQSAQPPARLPDEWVEKKLSSSEKRQRCSSARQRLQTIQGRARLKETDAKGNVRALTPKERDSRIKKLRKDIREYCR